ncbi:cyclic nucleotide-binding domain-containing protein 2-like isoform X2 [Ptychodera flava]|uniref:cyclic nucleotide-binding domain-containing protein 2-like isoform X2 n=1 Tax=Ptychodera flava TaxID=63121 RepID=UPI00396A352F
MESITVTPRDRYDHSIKREQMRETLVKMGITKPLRERDARPKVYRRASDLLSKGNNSIKFTPRSDGVRRRETEPLLGKIPLGRRGSLHLTNIVSGVMPAVNTISALTRREPSDSALSESIRRIGRTDDKKWKTRKASHTAYLVQKFRMVGKLIGFMYRLCKKHFHVADSEKSPQITMYGMEEREVDGDLLFDLSAFKAQKQGKVTQEAKRILKMEPRERTPKELYHVQVALRNIESIACYPAYMHRKLAEVGWYQSFEPKRLILRQGYMPINYYFVLSGSAVVSEFNVERDRTETVGILNKGESFGEKAILTCSTREATVVAMERIELLCIDIDDYTEIFMSGGLETLSQDENMEFLRSLYFLKDWPLDLLAENPKKCALSFFRKGQILVEDSANDKWIYIVKSGRCDLLKKVRKFKNGEVYEEERIPEKGSRIDMMFEARQTKDEAELFVEELRRARAERESQRCAQLAAIEENAGSDLVETDSLKSGNTSDESEEDLDESTDNREHTSDGNQTGDLNYRFIKIKSLTKGDTFGLADLAYGARRNFFLISEAAECVMLSKKFFLNNASIDTLLTIKKTESELPTDEELNNLLRRQTNWVQYRKDMVQLKVREKDRPR